MRAAFGLAALFTAAAALAAPLRQEVIDDFRDAGAWQASASDQVQARAHRAADGSLCLDYDFAGVSGYAVLSRRRPVDWPERFDLQLRMRGEGGRNDFQFKLVDASGQNVWWVNRPNHVLPAATGELRLRSRQIDFAWGPAADKRLRRTERIEFVIAAGRDGGRGALCLSRLALRERAPDPVPWPEVRRLEQGDALTLDLGLTREFNGLALQWPAGPQDYDLLARDDTRGPWRMLRRVRGSAGGLDALFLPESQARQLRIHRLRGGGWPGLQLRSAAEWPTLDAVIAARAAGLRRGDVPRAYVGQQNYWTLVGVDGGGARSGLMSEDGALEIGRGGASVEPAVSVAGGTPVTWADVKIEHGLADGHLPLPRATWTHPQFTLDIDAAADGPATAPELLARYTLRNTTAMRQTYTLLLALRPWQVNPPQQFLATQGGARELRQLQWRDGALQADRVATLRPTAMPARVSALPFDGGLGLPELAAAPALQTLDDPQAHASALLAFDITLDPGAERTLGWGAPLSGSAVPPAVDEAALARRFDAAAAAWRARLDRVIIEGPPELQRLVATLRRSLAHILMSRDGPALRPGTRSYARTWIRDGAMMVGALVRLGETEVAREFVDWYADHLFASGKVPCCVDARGADPVVENDSHGQYLYAVAEVMRHGGGASFAARHWPPVQRVLAWMEALRQTERGAANRTPERRHLFGLMPPSISHEGYSDKAAYSYWDDFWALRGYKDAVQLAQRLGHREEVARWAGWRDEFERELAASIEATALRWHVDFIAGAADRGDFDATSTTMALNPAQAALPRALLAATFERYWQEMSARSEGRRPYKDYTPYELRTVGALARLGQPARAHAMLDFFFKDQRPAGWNQWAEVVLPDPREVRFLGDMPHAWVSSDCIRSVLDLLAYDDERAAVLVLGAGLKADWLLQGDVVLRGLSTPYGRLDWSLTRTATGWRLDLPTVLSGLDGGARLHWPEELPLPRALHEGRVLAWQGRELALPAAPMRLELERP